MKQEGRAYLVEEGENPSTDYFVLPFLRQQGPVSERCNFSLLPPVKQLDGATLVFVRYIPAAWQALVDRCRDHIAAVYFL